jgi:GNAT superfamily N-acetyltransferase
MYNAAITMKNNRKPALFRIIGGNMQNLSIKALSIETWKGFEQLVQKHNGVWGGCWCTAFHPKSPLRGQSQELTKSYKEKLVKEDKAHAALVFDGDICVAWCQFGPPQELPNIYHRKEVESKMTKPDWRITCIFVDKDYRKKGLSFFALNGALELIKDLGGGIVESYPQDTEGRKVSNSFLYNGTREIFEKAGFNYEGKKGKNHCIMRKTT